jgi:hypothetical protein
MAKLKDTTIEKATTGGQNQIQFKEAGTTKTQITSNYGDNKFYLYHEGDNRLVIDSGGKVGIGTASPSSLLHISSGTSGDAVLTIEADTDNNNEADSPQIHLKQDGGATFNKVGIIGNANDVFTGSVANYSYMGGNNGLHLITNSVPKMTITTAGNVGIGDTTPSYTLEVAGDMAVNKIWDRNNGNYYLDPASTSKVNTLITEGSVVVDTNTNSNKFFISRTGSTANEYTAFGRDDSILHIHSKNDESGSSIRFRFENTDTETGGGANANDRNIEFLSDTSNARILVDGSIVWHSGNDGANSSLDADLLDGVQGSSYLRSDTDDTFTGVLTVDNVIILERSETSYGAGIRFSEAGVKNWEFKQDGDGGNNDSLILSNASGTSIIAYEQNGNVSFNSNILGHGNLYLNSDNTNADSYVYFGDSGSDTDHWLRFDTSAQQFGLSNRLVGTAGRLGAIEYNGSDVDKVNFALSGSTLTITTS